MTLKYQHLEEFMEMLRKRNIKEMWNGDFDLEVGKHFGLSDYVISNVKKKLREFGFIKESIANPNVWLIISKEEKVIDKIVNGG
jgi:hypothetical protein